MRLVEDYRKGLKHSVSSLLEFASITRIEVVFDEDVPPRGTFKFANICIADGKKYEPGYGMTKKDAKAKAAKLAFDNILGLAPASFTITGPSILDEQANDDLESVRSELTNQSFPLGAPEMAACT